MAITTDSYIDVRDTQSALQDKIGLSESLDNYTLDELTAYCYCGADNNLIRYPLIKTDTPAYASDVDIACHTESDASNRIVFTEGDPSPYSGTASIYGRVVWLCDTINSGDSVITSSNAANFKLVTEMKSNHYCYEWNAPQTVTVGNSSYGTTSWTGSDMTAHKIWSASGGFLSYYKDFSGGEVIDLSSHHIHPFFITEINSKLYCFAVSLDINHYKSNYNLYPADPDYPPEAGMSYSSWDGIESFDVCYAALQSWDSTFANTGWNFPYVYPRTAPGTYGWATIFQGFDTDKVTGLGVVGGTTYGLDCGWEFRYYFREREDVYTLLSGCGLYFKTDQIYKPIINNGYVIGYSDDLSSESDIDTWEGSTNHDIPPSPPGPAPISGDKVDDMTIDPLFGLSSDAGFAAYYLLTASDLASLHTWLTTTTFPTGYDPYSYIISLIQFPLKLSPTWCLAGTSGSVHIGGEDTGITASLIGTEQTWHGLGTFDVPRLNENFLDYDPYSQYEVYIPCCGWVTVPDIVAGHQISVRINYDLTDASIIGNVYVKINGDSLLIASKSGMMGRQTVISGEAQGVKSAQITSALLSAGTGALNVATGIMSGNAVSAVSGGYNIVSGLAQANIAGNSSYVRSIGSTGGRSLLCQYDKCYMKITTTEVDVPENYGHQVGYICNLKGKVSDFSGYTVFSNVDTSGIAGATERERQMIKRILESGVIINAAPSP